MSETTVKKQTTHRVLATREGLSGHRTSTGLIIDRDGRKMTDDDFFCALPSTAALHRMVRITRVRLSDGGMPPPSVTCPVLDVGPWNIHDDAYVFGMRETRPQAECGEDLFGRKTNKAGIDLSDGVWAALEMKDNEEVEWRFL